MKRYLLLLVITLVYFLPFSISHSQEKPRPKITQSGSEKVIIYRDQSAFKEGKGIIFEGDVENYFGRRLTTKEIQCDNPKYICDKNDKVCYLCGDGTVMCIPKEAVKKFGFPESHLK